MTSKAVSDMVKKIKPVVEDVVYDSEVDLEDVTWKPIWDDELTSLDDPVIILDNINSEFDLSVGSLDVNGTPETPLVDPNMTLYCHMESVDSKVSKTQICFSEILSWVFVCTWFYKMVFMVDHLLKLFKKRFSDFRSFWKKTPVFGLNICKKYRVVGNLGLHIIYTVFQSYRIFKHGLGSWKWLNIIRDKPKLSRIGRNRIFKTCIWDMEGFCSILFAGLTRLNWGKFSYQIFLNFRETSIRVLFSFSICDYTSLLKIKKLGLVYGWFRIWRELKWVGYPLQKISKFYGSLPKVRVRWKLGIMLGTTVFVLWSLLIYLWLRFKTHTYSFGIARFVRLLGSWMKVTMGATWFGSGKFYSKGGLRIGALFVYVADFWVDRKEVARSPEMVMGIKELTERVVAYDTSWVSRNKNFISDFFYDTNMLVVLVTELLLWYVSLRDVILRVAFFLNLELFLDHRILFQRTGYAWVISKSVVNVLGVPEMWSFPSKGGGDDTDLDTTLVGISLHLEHAFISGVSAYDYLLRRVVTWLLTWYECWLSNNYLCQGMVVRRVWLLSCSKAYSGLPIENLSWLLDILGSCLKSLASYFTSHLVPGLHNMHWMDRDEVKKR